MSEGGVRGWCCEGRWDQGGGGAVRKGGSGW